MGSASCVVNNKGYVFFAGGGAPNGVNTVDLYTIDGENETISHSSIETL